MYLVCNKVIIKMYWETAFESDSYFSDDPMTKWKQFQSNTRYPFSLKNLVHFVHSRKHSHYSDVTGTSWRLKSPATPLFVQPFVQAHIKGNIKAPRHWPLWAESTLTRPVTRPCLMTSSWILLQFTWDKMQYNVPGTHNRGTSQYHWGLWQLSTA